MLERFFRKQKPRVFLGTVAVTDRTDLKRHLEGNDFSGLPLDATLRRALAEILTLPPANCVEKPLPTDLVLDVWIPKYQSGEVVDIDLGEVGIALLWRPKVTVASRLSSLVTKRTKANFSITEKMKWGQYLGRVFSWRSLSRSQPFVREDMEYLLCQACLKLATRMQKVV